jgi:Mg2+ and Co2+ transporter CorA
MVVNNWEDEVSGSTPSFRAMARRSAAWGLCAGAGQRRSFELRKSLVLLRRVVLPMREVVNTLLRRDVHLVDDAMGPYFTRRQ